MTAQAVLNDLQALRVTLEARGDRLRFHPRDAVGTDLLARLREHKAELLAILSAPATTTPTAADSGLFQFCPHGRTPPGWSPPDGPGKNPRPPVADHDDLQPAPIDTEPDAGPRWDDLRDVARLPPRPPQYGG